uniref:Uncharacterized protein n=1 Tax=Arundo donax TaxID=35708 RepID=A0A0A8Z5B1_ARUDO
MRTASFLAESKIESFRVLPAEASAEAARWVMCSFRDGGRLAG